MKPYFGRGDAKFREYPKISIEQWHRRQVFGLIDGTPGTFSRCYGMRKRMLLLAAIFVACPAQADDAMTRGKYLAVLGDCAGCHTVQNGSPFAGGLAFTAQFGTVYSSNITPDRATGIGNWNRQQFYRALHEGVAADGRHLYPAFPYSYFTRMSRADSDALFAYLRTLKPVRAVAPPNQVHFPFNIRALMWFWNLFFLDDHRFQPDHTQTAAWNRGAFIVQGPGHCAACHTPKNILFGDETDKALTGALVGGWFSANLTGNQRGGLGRWSVGDIVRYLRTGKNAYATAAGSMQEKVSSSTSHMTDSDLAAIAVYLKSLKPRLPVHPAAPDASAMTAGEAVFVQSCSACHAGSSQPRDYPRLAGDTLVMGRDPTTVLRIILEGAESAQTPNGKTGYSMPSFEALSNGNIANVASYIRNAWGNRAGPVSAKDVARLRKSLVANP